MRYAGVLLISFLAATAAQAQDVKLLPTATERCLTTTPDSKPLVYPPELLRRGAFARVMVELTFTAPNRAPEVKAQPGSNEFEFLEAVQTHVKQLRVPCLEPGEAPARVVQTYVFKSEDQPVRWTSAEPDGDLRRQQLKCLRTPPGKPDYPMHALRSEIEGRIYARLTFTAPDQPPVIDIRGPETSLNVFKQAVEKWVQDYRLPCHEGPPLLTSSLFTYRFEGGRLYGFKDLDFMRFLGGVKGIDQQRLRFDTTTMGCPFDVRVFYLQPYLPNQVAQIGEPDPERQALLNWLTSVELNVSRRQQASVFGDTMTFTVPCIKLDLKPKD